MNIEEKINSALEKLKEITEKLQNPKNLTQEEFAELSKEQKKLFQLQNLYEEYKKIKKQIKEDEEIIETGDDEELIKVAKEEIEDLKENLQKIEREIKNLLRKKKIGTGNVVMEIRACAGGDEASLFALDLFRMYLKYAEKKGWDVEILSEHKTGIGGYKEVIFAVKGKDAYERLRFESGVHRVQRVPVTESSGRIHTSTASVAVLPEPTKVEIQINPNDIRIDTFKASGHGGQYVNKAVTAVRVVHIPTGITVSCQDERSQYQNKQKALRILYARLYEKKLKEEHEKEQKMRREQVGEGERAEKIRTYNFMQNRVTDHRIGLTLYKLEEILEGELDEIIDKLQEELDTE